MEFDFSDHALERMKARNIKKEDVFKVLQNFDFSVDQDQQTKIYSKLLTKEDKKFIYRVFVNEKLNPAKIITVYRTTKIEKYGY